MSKQRIKKEKNIEKEWFLSFSNGLSPEEIMENILSSLEISFTKEINGINTIYEFRNLNKIKSKIYLQKFNIYTNEIEEEILLLMKKFEEDYYQIFVCEMILHNQNFVKSIIENFISVKGNSPFDEVCPIDYYQTRKFPESLIPISIDERGGVRSYKKVFSKSESESTHSQKRCKGYISVKTFDEIQQKEEEIISFAHKEKVFLSEIYYDIGYEKNDKNKKGLIEIYKSGRCFVFVVNKVSDKIKVILSNI